MGSTDSPAGRHAPVKFTALVSSVLADLYPKAWPGLDAKERSLITGVTAKFEAIIDPAPATATLWGFELLALGPNREGFSDLTGKVRAENQGMLRAALLVTQLRSVKVFQEATRRHRGWHKLKFSLNLDQKLVEDDNRLRAIVQRYHADTLPSTIFEIHEHLPYECVARLKILRNDFEHIQYAIDDASQMDRRVHNALKKLAAVVKIDAGTFLEMAADRGERPEDLWGEIQHRAGGEQRPLIVEGVERLALRDFLDTRPGHLGPVLWQGYSVPPPKPWNDYLVALDDEPEKPARHVLMHDTGGYFLRRNIEDLRGRLDGIVTSGPDGRTQVWRILSEIERVYPWIRFYERDRGNREGELEELLRLAPLDMDRVFLNHVADSSEIFEPAVRDACRDALGRRRAT